MRIVRTIGLAAVIGATALTATAQNINWAVDARKSVMVLRAHYMGLLGGMAKGQIEYDAAKASAAANSLHALSTIDQSRMWPQGSSTEELGDATRALPKIWESPDDFKAKWGDFLSAAETLAAEAGKGADAMAAAFKAVGKSCGGCHKPYRAPKK